MTYKPGDEMVLKAGVPEGDDRLVDRDAFAGSLEATYRSDPRPEVQRFLDRMASERKFNEPVERLEGDEG